MFSHKKNFLKLFSNQLSFFDILHQAFSANFCNNSARNSKKYNQLFHEQVAFYRWKNVPDYICFKVDYIVTDNDEF
jgi:hypothetical protein